MNLVSKFQAVGTALKSQFLEREEVIDGMLCAALAGEHVLLVGAPGSAKSALVGSFSKMVEGANYFEWLLGKFTVPEELFGPISLQALKEEKFKRVTTGKLPEAHVCFLDEVFKASSSILNTLLPVLNERKFYNNGTPMHVPLRMVVGASNELPDGAELAALYDRFLVRFAVDYLEKSDNWVRMIMGVPKGHTVTISLADWDAAREEVQEIKIDQGAAQELHKLREKLKKDHSIVLSDRRWKQCVGLLRAAAWLSGESEILEDHFAVLAPALWEERGQIEAVDKVCKDAAGSTANEAQRVIEIVEKALATLPPLPLTEKATKEVQDQMVAAHREGARAQARLKELITMAKTDRAKKTAAAALAKVENQLAPMRQAMREALGL